MSRGLWQKLKDHEIEIKILNVFRKNKKALTTNEISKSIGKSFYTTLRRLEKLEKEGILQSSTFGNEKYRGKLWRYLEEKKKS